MTRALACQAPAQNLVMPASHFNRIVNEVTDIRDGNRPTASADKQRRERNYARGAISNYCQRTDIALLFPWLSNLADAIG